MSDVRIAVTGSTGQLGGRIARGLAERGIPQRLLVRDATRAPELPGATAVVSSYDDTHAVVDSLAGIDVLLMVSASESADRLAQHRAMVAAATRAGIGHIVYTSFVGAAPDATFTLARDHWATEEAIRASGMDVTFLRDNFYIDFLPLLVGEDGVIRGPAGNGRVAAVARDDIARSAVAVLADPSAHVGATYELSGPEALTFTEVADILRRATGRDVRFHDETIPEAYASRRAWEAPDWQYDAWVSTYTAIAAGEQEDVTHDVETLTGRAPLSLAAYLATSSPGA